MYFNILSCILLIWNIEVSFQMDFVVYKGDNLIKSNIVKRNTASDVPTIKEFIVKTSVANRFAETNVLSKVENSDKYAKQTTFAVVLPERAFISGFSMEIDGVMYKAFVKEKEEAQRIYGQSVTNGQTAAHVAVSTRNANRFTVNVNIEPESKVNFHLSYEELLQREKGEYEIIANIQPGQIVKKLVVEVSINESRPLLFVTTPSLRSGSGSVPNNVQLDPRATVKMSNTSALVKFQADVNRQLQFACAGLGNKVYDGFAGQFVVLYDIERDPQGGETFFQDGFFINFFAPPNLDPIAKHIVFVLDTSGSMDGIKIAQLKDAMMSILPQLYPDDLFNIVQYEGDVHLWDSNLNSINVLPSQPSYGNLAIQLQAMKLPEALVATPSNIDIAKQIVNRFEANGGTNTIAGLEVGLYLIKLVQESRTVKYQPLLVFLTDGLPNVGISDPAQIISMVQTINLREYSTLIYSVCIGSDADWDFLQQLSLSTKAVATRIYVDSVGVSDVSKQLKKFYEKIGTPVLSNVTINNLPPSTQLTQLYFPIFLNGTEIVIAGKGVTTNNTKPIKISGRGKKGHLDLEAKIGIPLTRLERVWAYLTVKQLIDESLVTNNHNKTDLQKLALEIALKYSLVTQLTSLVVVKPNNATTATNAVDASVGIFPQSPNELPMCSNITNWIIKNFGTPEPTTVEITTEMTTTTTPAPIKSTTTTKPTTTTRPTTTVKRTTTSRPTTTTMATTTEDINVIPEINIGVSIPTTTELPIKEKVISNCQGMPFGCCHDGVTAATGYNYSGCDPIPKAESCSLPQDSGSCSRPLTNKYSFKWSYNNIQGECRPFWYAGCGGNDNRFNSDENCKKMCVHPTGPDRCKLPIFIGRDKQRCAKPELSWFYDQKKDKCVKYLYSGCFGNSNRFPNKQECEQLCVSPSKKTRPQEVCSQPKNSGTCRRFETKYFYDASTGLCRLFWYGGCGGNENRFETEEQCNKICINPDDEDVCYLPAVKGRCTGSQKRWFFDKEKNICSEFNFGGCNGNRNNFEKREDCLKTCVKNTVVNLQEACFLKRDSGSCSNYTLQWAFSRKEARCTRFWYGGCDGNDNRFSSEKKCKEICVSPPGKEVCNLPRIPGTCAYNLTHWYYNKSKGRCNKFIYNGCFGNSNNFLSLDECNKLCL